MIDALPRAMKSLALANAPPSIKQIAALVTVAENGNGVIELIDELIADDLRRLQGSLSQNLIVLGKRTDCSAVQLSPYGHNKAFARAHQGAIGGLDFISFFCAESAPFDQYLENGIEDGVGWQTVGVALVGCQFGRRFLVDDAGGNQLPACADIDMAAERKDLGLVQVANQAQATIGVTVQGAIADR